MGRVRPTAADPDDDAPALTPTQLLDDYATSVVEGRVPAGKYHRRACERHLRDRARAVSPAFPYRFDDALASRFFRFAAKLRHYKGEWAGQPILLQPFQLFRLGSIFGWVHVETGLRRFHTAYNELPRKNGKSLEAAIVALYVTFFDGEPGAEGYCLATKLDQALIVFTDCKRLVQRSGLRTRIGVHTLNLHHHGSASKLEPLSAEADSLDGLNPSLLINDEYHARKDRALIDVMETATGARRQPLDFQITTAGSDMISPCGDQHDYACKILDEVIEDERFFAFIAHADPEDDWTLDSTARKANPNYGVSVKPEDLRARVLKARHMAPAAAAYKQLRLNLWVHSLTPWLSVDGWRAGQREASLDALAGEVCFLGIDMSSKIDLTAVVAVFPPTEARPRWRLEAICLTPEATLLERALRDRAPYEQWVEQGWLRTNPGNRIDQDEVLAIVRDDFASRFLVRQIGVDPWNAGNLVKDLGPDGDGFDVVEIPQTVQQISAPAKDFEADVLDALIDGGGNPLLTWCVSNVVVVRDNKDNIFPTKKRSRGRIDPVVAGLMGYKLATNDPGEQTADDPELVVA